MYTHYISTHSINKRISLLQKIPLLPKISELKSQFSEIVNQNNSEPYVLWYIWDLRGVCVDWGFDVRCV